MHEFTGSWVVFAYSLVYGFIVLYAISLALRYRHISKRFKREN
jgi:hypothetical protein